MYSSLMVRCLCPEHVNRSRVEVHHEVVLTIKPSENQPEISKEIKLGESQTQKCEPVALTALILGSLKTNGAVGTIKDLERLKSCYKRIGVSVPY